MLASRILLAPNGGSEEAGRARVPVAPEGWAERTMDEVIEGMEAVTVHIRDIERSRKFYSEVLGLREVSYLPEASRAAFAIPRSSTLLTMHILGEGEGGREPGTVSGVVFAHHDPVGACAEIRRRGGRSLTTRRRSPPPSERSLSGSWPIRTAISSSCGTSTPDRPCPSARHRFGDGSVGANPRLGGRAGADPLPGRSPTVTAP